MLILLHFRRHIVNIKMSYIFWEEYAFTAGQDVLSSVLNHCSVLPDTICILNIGNFISAGLSYILKNGSKKKNSIAGKMYNLADGLLFLG